MRLLTNHTSDMVVDVFAGLFVILLGIYPSSTHEGNKINISRIVDLNTQIQNFTVGLAKSMHLTSYITLNHLC